MKFAAVILLACVAVSSAAFTANLVQHTQPAVAKAMLSIRLAAGNKAVAIPALNSIFDSIQNTVNSILLQAQQVAAQGQAIGQALISQLQTAIQTLQLIGGQAANQLQQVIQNFLAGVHVTLNGSKGLFSSTIAAAQNAVQQAFTLAQQLISQINFPSLLNQAINAVLPQNIAQLVIAQLGLNSKGIFGDLFGTITGQISDIWGNISGSISALFSQLMEVGTNAFADVQAQASQFLSNVSAGVSHLSSQAASQILSHISDLSEALGDQYQAVVDALNGIVINGKQF